MSNILRNPWLATLTCKKLADGIAQRDGGTIEPGKVLDTIGPLGELQFPSDRFRPLQVIQFLSYDDPVTAVLSDKSVTITCKFSSASKSTYEASNGCMSIMKGGIIKPTSYHIHFLGVDGKLFWKGVTHEDQIAGEPISQKTTNRAKQARRSNAESSESVTIDSGIGNTKVNFPTPEPVLYIDTFIFLGSEGSAVWGSPTNISLKTDVENLLKKLPRKIYTKEETPLGFGQGRQPVDTVAESPLRGKARTRAKGHRSGNAARGTSKFSKLPKNAHNSDDEIRSQPEINGDVGEVSQLPFATQALGRFSSTYDDLEFPTRANKEKKAQPKTTFPASPFPNFSQSTGHSPQVVIITKSRRGDSRQTKASVEGGKKHNGGPKLINYSDGTSLDGSTTGYVTGGVGLKKMSGSDSNRRRQEPERHSPSPSEPGQLDVEAELPAKGPRWGWQGMTKVTKEDAFIPKNQQELLERPESWYPHQNSQNNQNNQYISGYSLVPKVQPIPKSHSPRNRLISHPTPTALTRQSSPISSSEGEEIPWPSSPVRPSKRDINAMPPDSSVPSGSQTYGTEIRRVGNQQNENSRSTQETSTEDSSSIPQQEPTLLKAGFSQTEISLVGSPPSTRESSEKEEMSGDVTMGKRVTRAANGISKKAPVDPNNVEPSRMARANKKLKVSVARKRFRPESESEEFSQESESSEDELINDPDLPFEVVNPNGRTRVDMFGGILKAQQVELWAKRKKTGCDSDENTEDEASWSDEDKMQSGGHVVGEPINDNGKRGNVLEKSAGEVAEPFDMESICANNKEQVLEYIQDTDDHSHNPRSQEFRNDLVKIVTGEERPSEVVLSSYLPEAVEPLLLSEPNNTAAPGVKDKAREPTPDPSFEVPVARLECIDTDDEGIPQAPLIPLNIMVDTKAKIFGTLKHTPFIGRPTEVSKPGKITLGNESQARGNDFPQLVIQPKVPPGDDLSTAALFHTSSTSALLDVHCPFETPPPLSPSASNTAPTIQVEETPYRKSGPEMRNIESPSPTISKAHAALGYESEDITLIPATNTEELSNSSTSASFLTAQPSTPERGSSPPEAQVISLDHISSSLETEAGPPGDFFTPQRQLQREMQQCAEIEVPATSETGRVQCARPPPRRLSKARKPKKLTKSVDFHSQEIRAANARNVSSQLEKQKKEFLSLEDEYDFGSLDFQEDCPPPTNENQCEELEMEIPESLRKAVRDSPAPTPVSPVRTYVLISSDDEDVASNMSQSNTRKRHQPAPLNVPKPAKKLRADEFTYGTSYSSPAILPSHHVAENRNKIPAGSRNKSSPRIAEMESVEDKDEVEVEPELDNNDLMAGFPTIHLPIDNVPESSWSSQIPSRPEIYAGIRERHLDVPGYGNLTDGQKNELDKRRQEYFGITPREGTKRLFSAKLQRAMQAARPPLPLKRQSKHTEAGKPVANEWYRDENTPLKIFYRKFKELRQVRAELQGGTDASGS